MAKMQGVKTNAYKEVRVICDCGNEFTTRSTYDNKDGKLELNVCSACHPFYTKKMQQISKSSSAQDFRDTFGSAYISDFISADGADTE